MSAADRPRLRAQPVAEKAFGDYMRREHVRPPNSLAPPPYVAQYLHVHGRNRASKYLNEVAAGAAAYDARVATRPRVQDMRPRVWGTKAHTPRTLTDGAIEAMQEKRRGTLT